RRRHTRSKRDWSSDVCSSDLHTHTTPKKSSSPFEVHSPPTKHLSFTSLDRKLSLPTDASERALKNGTSSSSRYCWLSVSLKLIRSEERRGGKEGGRERTQDRT